MVAGVALADLRCGVDRLLAKVRDELGQDVRAGDAYAFRNRSATRMKVVCVDATLPNKNMVCECLLSNNGAHMQ